MPEYLSPGVYVEEISTGPRPIEGVGTSTAGFIGGAERGPEAPSLVTSWLDYQRWYGSYVPDTSYLAYAIQGFFDNGGQRCFISRIVAADAVAATMTLGNLQWVAYGRGTWGNRIRVKVEPSTSRPTTWFKVTILYYRVFPETFIDPTDPANATNPERREPDVLEVFDNLSAQEGASNNVKTVLN